MPTIYLPKLPFITNQPSKIVTKEPENQNSRTNSDIKINVGDLGMANTQKATLSNMLVKLPQIQRQPSMRRIET